jgi:fructan beta-fructosidase
MKIVIILILLVLEILNQNHKPFYHYTPNKGYMNDPNGLVYYKNNYHMFFQYNPKEAKWGDIVWGNYINNQRTCIQFRSNKLD